MERTAQSLERMVARVAAIRGQTSERLVRDNQGFWNDQDNEDLGSQSHWRGQGPFQDDALWLKLGQAHRSLFDRAATWAELAAPLDRIVEWGCGGGMNAVQFAALGREYCGVDIGVRSLEECARQMSLVGGARFSPILIDAGEPEAATRHIGGACDLFLCTYVFELLPSPEYGLRVMRLALDVMRPGAVALVQIRYHTGALGERSRRRDYAANAVQMTTYAIDEFWSECEGIGFKPLFVHVVPELPELSESRYAYFALTK